MQGRLLLRVLAVAASFAVFGASAGAVPTPATAAHPASLTQELAPAKAPSPRTVSATVQRSPQMNGVAWASKIHAGIAYLGGAFTAARPAAAAPGENEVPRTNFLAFDLASGELVDFAPSFNGEIRTMKVSADGRLLFVGGNFTQVDGQPRARFAAFDLASGQLTDLAPAFDYYVYDITDRGDTIYVAGRFASVDDKPRTNVAAVRYDAQNPRSYQLLDWAPFVNDSVRGIEIDPTGANVVIGGNFLEVAGRPARGWARIDARTGDAKSWPANQVIQPGDSDSAIYSLQSTANGVYATAYSFGGMTPFEGVVFADWEGTIQWVKGCKGDTYDTAIMDGVVYSVGHTHNCEPLGGITDHDPWHYQRAEAVTELAAPGAVNQGLEYDGMPAPKLLHWYPSLAPGDVTKQWQAAWTVDAADGYLVLGGEFPSVNDVRTQGIALFAYADRAPSTEGPRVYPSDETVGLEATGPGQVTASLRTTYDYDSTELRYELLRGEQVVAHEVRRGGAFWNVEPLTLIDPFAPNGDYQYSVRVTDPDGNAVRTDPVNFTVSNAPDLPDLTTMRTQDQASSVWRLKETTGPIAWSLGLRDPMIFGDSTVWGNASALGEGDDSSAELTGEDYVPAATTVARWMSENYTAELWFKTDTERGGMLMNFGTSRIGTSRLRDRALYMTTDGRVAAGVLAPTPTTIISERAFNDGQWHQAAVTYSGGDLSLFIDGQPIGSQTGLPGADRFAGYWKVGGDPLGDWPDTPASWRFKGAVDEVAVYDRALGADRIAMHWYASRQD